MPNSAHVIELPREPDCRRGPLNIAYLDPPYSRYFERLAARLARRTGGEVLALLSSPAYRLYTGADRTVVWPPGTLPDAPALPADGAHALWSHPHDAAFRAVFWHAVAWFRERFREQGIRLCLIFSDARPFSFAAAVAARELGVRCLYFERGAFRMRTASLSTQGLNARFSLRRAREIEAITGVADDVVLERRPRERWLYWNFLRFIVANQWHCGAAPARRLLQHKRYALTPYARLALAQWWAERSLSRRRDARLGVAAATSLVVVPLQLPADSQWRLHSPFANNQEFLDFVVQQARRVAPEVRVLVKRHPMDSLRYRMPEGAVAVAGNLSRFYRFEPVVVCINSTVGFEAAVRGLPVICFGDSFYTDSELVRRCARAQFADRLAACLAQSGRIEPGRALLAEVLRCYQAPGDTWGYSDDDLERTAEIALQHYRAAQSASARAGAATVRVLQPAAQVGQG